jgi:hypothetical protein
MEDRARATFDPEFAAYEHEAGLEPEDLGFDDDAHDDDADEAGYEWTEGLKERLSSVRIRCWGARPLQSVVQRRCVDKGYFLYIYEYPLVGLLNLTSSHLDFAERSSSPKSTPTVMASSTRRNFWGGNCATAMKSNTAA